VVQRQARAGGIGVGRGLQRGVGLLRGAHWGRCRQRQESDICIDNTEGSPGLVGGAADRGPSSFYSEGAAVANAAGLRQLVTRAARKRFTDRDPAGAAAAQTRPRSTLSSVPPTAAMHSSACAAAAAAPRLTPTPPPHPPTERQAQRRLRLVRQGPGRACRGEGQAGAGARRRRRGCLPDQGEQGADRAAVQPRGAGRQEEGRAGQDLQGGRLPEVHVQLPEPAGGEGQAGAAGRDLREL